jgi:phosphatidylglycerol:prolipoprotein diacylglycerol transferase
MVLGHFGAFLDGTSYGRETNLPWGMIFESPSIKYAVPIHPAQLYAMLYSAIIALVLVILFKKNAVKQGTITIIAIISYFSMMFLEGFIRGDDVFVFLSLREEQWLSLIVLIATGSYLYYRYNKSKKKQSTDHQNHA